jgi:hypothetical protein
MIKLEKNLPGLQIYQLEDLSICDRLIERLNHIRKNKLSENNNNTCFKSQGYQSGNLLELEDPDLLEFSSLMRFHLARNFGIDQEGLDFVFLHFLDYGQQGRMDEHDHKDKEDLTFLLYLNDCTDGDTVFYLNFANERSRQRSQIAVNPKKGRLAVFSSVIPHEGTITHNNKKIFAGGLSYNAINTQ